MEDDQQKKIPLDNIPITSFPTALNILYEYLNMASRRGAFGLTDSAKIMNCLDFISYNVRPLTNQTDGIKLKENENKEDTNDTIKDDNKVTSGVRKKT